MVLDGETSPSKDERSLDLVPFSDMQLYDVLGSGGFGSVRFGVWAQREVAVKRTHQRLKTAKAFSDSLSAELDAASLLQHPNIVEVLGICEDHSFQNELPLLVMEYAGDRNLQTLVEDHTEIVDPSRRLRFARDIARGLAFAHSRGVLHLDVKLLNVIVDREDQCKLGDFGCSQSKSDNQPVTPTKASMTGTFAYKAPELLRGRTATEKSDVYSLAVCLWQLMTREKPYGYEEHQVVIFAVVAYNLRPSVPETISGECEQAYCQLFRQAWNADPLQRPTAAETLQRLDGIQVQVDE